MSMGSQCYKAPWNMWSATLGGESHLHVRVGAFTSASVSISVCACAYMNTCITHVRPTRCVVYAQLGAPPAQV